MDIETKNVRIKIDKEVVLSIIALICWALSPLIGFPDESGVSSVQPFPSPILVWEESGIPQIGQDFLPRGKTTNPSDLGYADWERLNQMLLTACQDNRNDTEISAFCHDATLAPGRR